MPIYKFQCLSEECKIKFESIEKIGTELIYCPECKKLAKRTHGQDLPSPALIEAGVGGVYRPKWGERRF